MKLPADKPEAGHPIDNPVEIQGKVKAIIMPAGPLKPYFQRDEDCFIYVVTEKEVVKYWVDGHKWKEFDEDNSNPFGG